MSQFEIPQLGKATQVGMVTLLNLTEGYVAQLQKIGQEMHAATMEGDTEALPKFVAQQDACMMSYRDAMARAVTLFDELLRKKV